MIKAFRHTLLLVLSFVMALAAQGQITADPTNWTTELKKIGNNEYEVRVHLK